MTPWQKGKGKGKGVAEKNIVKTVSEAVSTALTAAFGGGAGKMAGNANSSVMKQGQWMCRCDWCQWALQAKPNHGFRKSCGGCGTMKSDAMNPPLRFRVTQTGSPTISLKQQQPQQLQSKKETKGTGKGKGKKEAEQQMSIPVIHATEPLDLAKVSAAVKEVKTEEKKVAFTAEQAEAFKSLAPILQEVFVSLSKEKRARPWTSEKDPGQTAETFLKDSTHVAKGFELEAAELELQRLQRAQDLFPETDPLHKQIAEKLEAAKALVQRLGKTVPSESLKTSCLAEVKAAYRRHCQARKDRSEKGRLAADERKHQRRQLVRKLKEELEEFEDALDTLDQELEDEYTQLNSDLDAFDEEVMNTLQNKLGQEADEHSINKEEDPLVARLRRDTEEAQERVRRAEAELAKAKAEAAERGSGATGTGEDSQPDEEMDIDALDETTLPTLDTPKPEYVPTLDRAWNVLTLARWTPLAKALSPEVIGLTTSQIKELLGPLWEQVYPAAQPTEQAPLNAAAIYLLDVALNNLGTQLAKRSADERKTARDQAKTALGAAAKKARTQ